ncbi:MAG: endonuclease domain-containing protein, partial [Actinomycetota bacterium]|nr:endonuclease domain-containing protein [Actinomycetota bacterium]
ADRVEGYVAPESGLEARFLSIVQAAGLPLPVRQRDLGGEEWVGRVDFLYPEERLVVEIDSARHHTTLSDEAADTDRDRALHEAGYRVVRIGEQLVWHRPQEVVRRVLAS